MCTLRESKEPASESAKENEGNGDEQKRGRKKSDETLRAHASLIVGVGNVLTREAERTLCL